MTRQSSRPDSLVVKCLFHAVLLGFIGYQSFPSGFGAGAAVIS
jgi:hypothetical protein